MLADLPSRDTLLAQFAGALSAPLQQLAGLIQALPRNLAYGLSALIDQRQAAGEVLAEADTPTTDEVTDGSGRGRRRRQPTPRPPTAEAAAETAEATEPSRRAPAEAEAAEAEAAGARPKPPPRRE